MDIVKANILIDETKRARLADFGLLMVVSDTTNLMSSSSFTQGGTHRWMSPELFDPENFVRKPHPNHSLRSLRAFTFENLHKNGIAVVPGKRYLPAQNFVG